VRFGSAKKSFFTMENQSFSDIAVVACGTLTMELSHLGESGFPDARHIFFTVLGLHETLRELEKQLIQRIQTARSKIDEAIEEAMLAHKPLSEK
jgi:hypothetical protein